MNTRTSRPFTGLDGFTLKLLAIAAMLVDHVGHIFFPNALWMRVIGRLTFPIMAFFIVQGYVHTRNLRRYILRLLAAGAVSVIPFGLAMQSWIHAGNVMLTLALGVIALWVMDHITRRWLAAALLIALILLSHFGDWSYYGIMIILAFGLAQKKNTPYNSGVLWIFSLMLLDGIIAAFISTQPLSQRIWMPLAYGGGCFLALPLLKCYNGQRGRDARWLFYGFYPLHLAVLAGIRLLLAI